MNFVNRVQSYKHPEWTGPYLGPKTSEKNQRHFTEEQLRGGETVIGLQAGTNRGANQSGLSMGATRKILLGKWGASRIHVKDTSSSPTSSLTSLSKAFAEEKKRNHSNQKLIIYYCSIANY